ncbi:MAG TPA: (2Fe-2S)-binding protein [Acidimicrobiia bacterium]|nr:(2Fe-2S)-binding protein [Acidimicrobiia bacterium]
MSDTRTIRTTLNGEERDVEIRDNQTLLDLVRDELSLTGSVEGCGVGVCGSCTVLIDDGPVSSCLTLATNVEGRAVTTIEGLAVDGTLHRVQQAFLEQQAFQCGFCTPGMIMAVTGLLREHPNASEEEARDYLSGNLCRCGTYKEVLAAIETLVRP